MPEGLAADLVAAAREQLRTHFRCRADQRRRELVDEWRAEGLYPYTGEPASDPARAERETFDIVATAVFRHLPASKRAQKVSFALLRSVLAHEPGDVLRIAEELFALSKQEQEELSRLLDRTPCHPSSRRRRRRRTVWTSWRRWSIWCSSRRRGSG